MFEKLTNENVLMYAILQYQNERCLGSQEFFEDYKRVGYVKKLITQYENSGELKNKLLLVNHMISLYNVFNNDGLNKILYFRIDEKNHPILKALMVYLNRDSQWDYTIPDPKTLKLLRDI